MADEIIYERAQKHVNGAVNRAKGHYEDKLVNELESNPKLCWNYTRHFTRSTSTIDFLHDCGERVTDDRKKAEVLNDFFASVLTEETDINSSEIPTTEGNVNFVLKDLLLKPQDVRLKLIKLQGNKASGPDLININVLRNCQI